MRTSGGRVACGGSKCSSIASLRLARASSSVSPWLATSSSRHWETYHRPSRQTVAANGRFMTSLFHGQERFARPLGFRPVPVKFGHSRRHGSSVGVQHASHSDPTGVWDGWSLPDGAIMGVCLLFPITPLFVQNPFSWPPSSIFV